MFFSSAARRKYCRLRKFMPIAPFAPSYHRSLPVARAREKVLVFFRKMVFNEAASPPEGPACAQAGAPGGKRRICRVRTKETRDRGQMVQGLRDLRRLLPQTDFGDPRREGRDPGRGTMYFLWAVRFNDGCR